MSRRNSNKSNASSKQSGTSSKHSGTDSSISQGTSHIIMSSTLTGSDSVPLGLEMQGAKANALADAKSSEGPIDDCGPFGSLDALFGEPSAMAVPTKKLTRPASAPCLFPGRKRPKSPLKTRPSSASAVGRSH